MATKTKLKGPRVTIRPMQRKDVDAMMQWRPFADPLYQPFDFARQGRRHQIQWFEWRSRDPHRLLFTIENAQGAVVGSLTLREIEGRLTARLGITIGADFVSQGYGTEALGIFLDYYFEEMGFARMVLDVAATNLRAIRTYKSLGFQTYGQHYRPALHHSYRTVREEPRYRHLHRFFRRQGTTYQVLFYDMVLTREDWRRVRRSPDQP